jgi:hypothetical protein
MNRLEEELRNSLARKEAPAGFAERVTARIRAKAPREQRGWEKWISLFRLPKVAWTAVGVVTCLTVAIGIIQYRGYQKTRAQGELAKNQLMLALKIAGTKLSFAQRKVLEIHNRAVPAERSGDQ